MMKAWSLLAVGDDRQHGGNLGYKDDLRFLYHYDSLVANHKQIAIGDFVVLRDRAQALGTATVVSLSEQQGPKLMRRCPVCRTTGIKIRKTKTPPWRCSEKHEFDVPSEEEIEVILYEAGFGSTFNEMQERIPAAELKSVALRPGDQISMEELDLRALEGLFAKDLPGQEKLQKAAVRSSLGPQDGDPDYADDLLSSLTDQRKATLRSIKARRGQRKFRKALLMRYGSACAVTACQVLDLLEAAHIIPYRGEAYNKPSNGLLLRADIHTLFDLGLLRIEPKIHRVEIDASISDPSYRQYHGVCLTFPNGKPCHDCLSMRWESSAS